MLSDFHLHTAFSADSDAPVRSQIEKAAALGMHELCITDHHDYDSRKPDNDFLLDFSKYLPYMNAFRDEYRSKIRVNIGVELGLQIHEKQELDHLVSTWDLDFVIGSSHFIDSLDPYYPEFFQGRSEKEAYERYFQITLERVRAMDCFDIFGHLDYVVRYGPTTNKHYSYTAYRGFVDPILTTLIEKGKGLECNTGGLKYGLGHPNPCEEILKRYRELGGEILTVGSDAHAPQHVGYDFHLLPELLKNCGFRYYTVFHGRKPEFLPL